MSRVVLATFVVVSAVANAPARAEVSRPQEMTLRSCLLSGVNYEDSQERMIEEGWVPPGYAMMPADRSSPSAVVMIWTLSCETGGIGAVEFSDASISVVGVALEYTAADDPTQWPNIVPDWPGNWGVYVVDIFTDNPAVASWLHSAGMPAVVRPIAFEEAFVVEAPPSPSQEIGHVDTCNQSVGDAPGIAHSAPDAIQAPEVNKTTTVSVGIGATAFRTMTTPLAHHNVVTHCHDQVLHHGPHGSGTKIKLSIPQARDHFCQHPMPDCGTAEAAHGIVARFLENGFRDDPVLAFDHERIGTVHFTVM